MDGRRHSYALEVRWTGDLGVGTRDYRAYSRSHEISAPRKPALPGSSDAVFWGDPARYSPEELLLGSLSACHMLWYLHLCAEAGITVTGYHDRPTGAMVEAADRGGAFEEVVLEPEVEIAAGGDVQLAESLHEWAHDLCYIARSVNFPVRCRPSIVVRASAQQEIRPTG